MEEVTERLSPNQKSELLEKINAAADAAYSKFSKYFADKTPELKEGLYPARVFLKEIQFFNQRKSLAFNEIPRLEEIPGFANVPRNELSGYRILARDYSFEPSENEDSLEGIAREMQQIKDFWASCSTQLPNLSKLALTYAFVLCKSASVERCFTYYNKLLEDERQSLDTISFKYLLFLYVNALKIEI